MKTEDSRSSGSSCSACEPPASRLIGLDVGSGRGTAQPTTVACTSQTTWWGYLFLLQAATAGQRQDGEWLKQVLKAALASVRDDEQWNCSGIPELLLRAMELAEQGHFSLSLAKAISLLDFHLLVEKYRSVVTRSSSSQESGGKRGNEEGAAAMEVESPGPAAKRPRMGCEGCDLPACPASSGGRPVNPIKQQPQQQEPGADNFAKPTHRASLAKPAAPASDAPKSTRSTARPVQHACTWTGNIVQDAHGRAVQYCSAAIEVPAEHIAEFGSALEVSHLAPRKGVKLGEHYVCKCSIASLSRSQTAKLKSLAQHELVLVAPLSKNGIILVPYLDNSGVVKLVGFFVLVPSS